MIYDLGYHVTHAVLYKPELLQLYLEIMIGTVSLCKHVGSLNSFHDDSTTLSFKSFMKSCMY